jgi:hypothetical protein
MDALIFHFVVMMVGAHGQPLSMPVCFSGGKKGLARFAACRSLLGTRMGGGRFLQKL